MILQAVSMIKKSPSTIKIPGFGFFELNIWISVNQFMVFIALIRILVEKIILAKSFLFIVVNLLTYKKFLFISPRRLVR